MNKVGGDIVRPYQPAGYYAPLNFPEREYEPSTGDDQFRRAVYVHWQRQFLHPWLVAFDAPSRQECTADRPLSNTPNAALVLLNDPSYVEAARALAARVLTQNGNRATTASVSRWAWQTVLGREPATDEAAELLQLLDEASRPVSPPIARRPRPSCRSASRRGPTDVDVAELAAWTSVSRVLLNLNETITRN